MWSVLLLVLELVLVLVIMVRSVPESGEVLVHVVRSTLTVFSEVGLLAVDRVPSKMNMGFSRYFQGFFKAFSVDFKVFLCSGSSD